MNGILPVNKPSGISSFDVIRRIKGIIPKEQRKSEKIGHGGTLDVLADGVLPILFGEATKAFDYLLESDKIYIAEVQLGALTNTDDAEGEVIQIFDKKLSLEEIQSVLPGLTGKIMQVPPKFSALKINGQRSYDLARGNQEVEHQPRPVNIFKNTILGFNFESQVLNLEVNCSSGTYIRSLARDIGQKLGSGGYIKQLKRTKSAGIFLSQCVELESLTFETLQAALLDLNGCLNIPEAVLKGPESYIYQGRLLSDSLFQTAPSNGVFKITSDAKLIAIAEKADGKIKYNRVFHG